MSQTLDEQLSALYDGELADEQYELLARRMESDPAFRERFAHFGLIGDVLSGTPAPVEPLGLADRVLEGLEDIDTHAAPGDRGGIAAGGLLGAGIAAAAALVVALNLDPGGDAAVAPRTTGSTPVPVVSATPQPSPRASIDPARMTRYLIAHSEYANPATRQFVDSHIVAPAFQRAAWQTPGSVR